MITALWRSLWRIKTISTFTFAFVFFFANLLRCIDDIMIRYFFVPVCVRRRQTFENGKIALANKQKRVALILLLNVGLYMWSSQNIFLLSFSLSCMCCGEIEGFILDLTLLIGKPVFCSWQLHLDWPKQLVALRIDYVNRSSLVFYFDISDLMDRHLFIVISFSLSPSSSSESLNPLNNSSTMPSSELAYDAYRFRRLNDQEQMTSAANPTSRLRNVAKVEPYSINTNMVRPLYQSSPSPSASLPSTKIIPTTKTTTVPPPSQARTILNSMGNTPTHSSASSSAGSLNGMIRHPNVRHSDFLVPNPAYAPPTVKPPAPSVLPSASHRSQPVSNSTSYATPPPSSRLLSDSLSQRSAVNNAPLYNGRSTNLAASVNDQQQKYRGPPLQEFPSAKVIPFASSGQHLRSICSSSKRIRLWSTDKATQYHHLVKTRINTRNLITILHRCRIIIVHETDLRQQAQLIHPSMLIEKNLKDRHARLLPISTNNNNNSSNWMIGQVVSVHNNRRLVVDSIDVSKWNVRKAPISIKTRRRRSRRIKTITFSRRPCHLIRTDKSVSHDRSVENASSDEKVMGIFPPRRQSHRRPLRILNESIEQP